MQTIHLGVSRLQIDKFIFLTLEIVVSFSGIQMGRVAVLLVSVCVCGLFASSSAQLIAATNLTLYWWGNIGTTPNSPIVAVPTTGLPSTQIVKALVCGGQTLVVLVKDAQWQNRAFFWSGSASTGAWNAINPSGIAWSLLAPTAGPGDIFCSAQTNTLILRSPQNQLWGAGDNSFGQLGSASKGVFTPLTAPRLLSFGLFQTWINGPFDTVYMGPNYTLFTSQGSVYGVGDNSLNQLGLGAGLSAALDPTVIPVLSNKAVIVLGHGWAQGWLGTYVWGPNADGELCQGHTNPITTPTLAVNLPAAGVVQVARAARHTVLLDSSKKIWGCGLNAASTRLLGVTATGTFSVPTAADLGLLSSGLGQYIVSNDLNTLVVLCSGQVAIWGKNANGQIAGSPVNVDVNTPFGTTLVSPVSYASPWAAALALGVSSGMAVTFPPITAGAASGLTPSIVNGFRFQLPSGTLASPLWTMSLNHTTFNVSYAFDEVTPSGAVVQTASVAPGRWFALPASANVSVSVSLLFAGTLDNCAFIFLNITGFVSSATVKFANTVLPYNANDVKLSLAVLGWPYKSVANSVRWSLIVSSSDSLGVQTSTSRSGNFAYLKISTLSSPPTSIQFRTLELAEIGTASDIFLTNPTITASTTQIVQPSSQVVALQLILPAGAPVCAVDPDLSVLAEVPSSLSPGAIAGIAIGAVVGGILLGVLVVVLTRYFMKKHEQQGKIELREKDAQNLRNAYVTN
jgi:hypothetical protein